WSATAAISRPPSDPTPPAATSPRARWNSPVTGPVSASTSTPPPTSSGWSRWAPARRLALSCPTSAGSVTFTSPSAECARGSPCPGSPRDDRAHVEMRGRPRVGDDRFCESYGNRQAAAAANAAPGRDAAPARPGDTAFAAGSLPQSRTELARLQRQGARTGRGRLAAAAGAREVPRHLLLQSRRVLHGARRRAQTPRRDRAVGALGRRAFAQ